MTHKIVQMYLLLEDISNLDISSADIGNTYLNNPYRVNTCTIVGAKIFSGKLKVMIIVRELYGFKIS